MLILIGVVLVSYLLYQGEFSILNKQISELDNLQSNPIGSYVFEIGFIVTGCLFVPNAMNIIVLMQKKNKIIGTLAGIFYCMAGLGMIVVGFFPVRRSYIMHIVGAGLGFGGLAMGIFLSLILIFVKGEKTAQATPTTQTTPLCLNIRLLAVVFYVPFLIAVILAIIFAGIPVIESMQTGSEFGEFVPNGWEIYEWAMFFTGLFSMFGTQRIF
jgi:hypothetical protein